MSRVLPENFLRLMSAEERKAIGQPNASEAQARWQRGEEKKMHEALIQDLNRRQWPFIHSRMDKPSTIRKGFPDFTVMNAGRVACIELKAPGGSLSEDQRTCIAEIEASGTPVIVTDDLGEAIRFAVKHLAL